MKDRPKNEKRNGPVAAKFLGRYSEGHFTCQAVQYRQALTFLIRTARSATAEV